MMNPINQKLHWNKLHQNKSLEKYSYQPTNFAKEVIKLFPNNANILELGCGLGNDAIFFAQNGHFVLATDVSDEVIRQNQFRCNNPNLNFNDPSYGQGQRIEKDMFIDKEHIRHFFDKDYAKECLYENFKIEKIKSVHGDLYGKESGYLKVVARKL